MPFTSVQVVPFLCWALTDDISVADTQAVEAEARAAAADMQVSDSVIMCTRRTRLHTQDSFTALYHIPF